MALDQPIISGNQKKRASQVRKEKMEETAEERKMKW